MTQQPNDHLVFISYDHREEAIAECFAEAISDVSGGLLQAFYASSGVEYGEDWFQKITLQLSAATDVVCILTPGSMDRPWIYFEAGFARGKSEGDTPLAALLVGVDAAQAKAGPFSHFKFVPSQPEDVTLLLQQIAERAGYAPSENSVAAAANNFLERVQSLSSRTQELCPSDALHAYRSCVLHAKTTAACLEHLNEHDKGTDQEIYTALESKEQLVPTLSHWRHVLFSLFKSGLLTKGVLIKITRLGRLTYENLKRVDEDPEPVQGELEAYRSLVSEMNFVPRILGILFAEGLDGEMSDSALMKIVRTESDDLPREQAEAGYRLTSKMLRSASVIDGEEGETMKLTQRGRAMCADFFST